MNEKRACRARLCLITLSAQFTLNLEIRAHANVTEASTATAGIAKNPTIEHAISRITLTATLPRNAQRMLILTRREGESLVIDDGVRQIRVTVLGIKGGNVKLGFEASRDVEIHRQELYEQMRREREDAEKESPA